jgi:hypothetical protein
MTYSRVGAGAIRGGVGAFSVGTLDFGAGASSEGAKTAGAALIFFLSLSLFKSLKKFKTSCFHEGSVTAISDC